MYVEYDKFIHFSNIFINLIFIIIGILGIIALTNSIIYYPVIQRIIHNDIIKIYEIAYSYEKESERINLFNTMLHFYTNSLYNNTIKGCNLFDFSNFSII